jgi:hypothetical protein
VSVILDTKVPIEVKAGANLREHWTVRARRINRERRDLRLSIGHLVSPTAAPLAVAFTRIAPRELDDDNLANAFKHLRDELAFLLGRDDGPRAGIEWRYAQRKGHPREYAVHILIERTSDA